METQEILSNHDLRSTSVRKEVLDLFLDREHALSEKDLEHELSGNCNRVTIYRTLKTFLDKGIVHKVLDDNNIVKYALCSHSCTAHMHQHEHVHFKCEDCGNTICLDHLPLQEIKLPNGFSKKESNMLIIGLCDRCNQ